MLGSKRIAKTDNRLKRKRLLTTTSFPRPMVAPLFKQLNAQIFPWFPGLTATSPLHEVPFVGAPFFF
jgi:hypothetical protein